MSYLIFLGALHITRSEPALAQDVIPRLKCNVGGKPRRTGENFDGFVYAQIGIGE